VIRSDQQAVSEPQFVSYGSCVVSEQAHAIGITAVPTPITDSGSDLWFTYDSLANMFLQASAVGISGQGNSVIQYDSKAMRKVEDGEQLITVAEVAASTVSEGARVTVLERQLLKLS